MRAEIRLADGRYFFGTVPLQPNGEPPRKVSHYDSKRGVDVWVFIDAASYRRNRQLIYKES